mgnify:CR=1 FL=1
MKSYRNPQWQNLYIRKHRKQTLKKLKVYAGILQFKLKKKATAKGAHRTGITFPGITNYNKR